jgi:hypothetical protein
MYTTRWPPSSITAVAGTLNAERVRPVNTRACTGDERSQAVKRQEHKIHYAKLPITGAAVGTVACPPADSAPKEFGEISRSNIVIGGEIGPIFQIASLPKQERPEMAELLRRPAASSGSD